MSLAALQDAIRDAAARRAPLRLRGGGTKDFYGNALHGEVLDTRGYAGIVDYEPSELVLTARCGTPLAEVERTLAERGQCLAFEPPHFGAGATFGGCIAAGLSGPRRMAAGAVRDFVLGVKIVNGKGEVLSFGGRVMKNVAGYDVSRLVTGSLGILGLVVEASVKVLPRPPGELTLSLELSREAALDAFRAWAALPLPVSATLWHEGVAHVRLSGSAPALASARKRVGGAEGDGALWQAVREQTHPFFSGPEPLWRIAVPPAAAPLGLPGRELVEWSGALRWLKSDAPPEAIREAAKRAGGHATLFRAAHKPVPVFAPLDALTLRVHRGLKAAFDPAGIFNPGRMIPEL